MSRDGVFPVSGEDKQSKQHSGNGQGAVTPDGVERAQTTRELEEQLRKLLAGED